MELATVKCPFCGYEWIPRVPNPKKCPRCTRRLKNVEVKVDKSYDSCKNIETKEEITIDKAIKIISNVKIFRRKYKNHTTIPISLFVYCPRKAFFNYYLKGVEYVGKDYLLAGNYIHEKILNELKRVGYEIEKEVEYRLPFGFRLLGIVDAVNNDHVIEIKSVKYFTTFDKQHWFDQLNLYMYILNVKKGLLVVVDRMTGEKHFKEYELDEKRAKELINLAEEVAKAITLKNPSLLPRHNDYRCKYCSANWVCVKF